MAIVIGDDREQIRAFVEQYFPDAVLIIRSPYYEWDLGSWQVLGIDNEGYKVLNRDIPIIVISNDPNIAAFVKAHFREIEYLDEYGNIVKYQ